MRNLVKLVTLLSLSCVPLEADPPPRCPLQLTYEECDALPNPPARVEGQDAALEMTRTWFYSKTGYRPKTTPSMAFENRVARFETPLYEDGAIGLAYKVHGRCEVWVIEEHWERSIPHELIHCWLDEAGFGMNSKHDHPIWDYQEEIRRHVKEFVGAYGDLP